MSNLDPAVDNMSKLSDSNKKVTTACESCRRRRGKCDGQNPCTTCRKSKEPCLYTSVDGRRERHKRKPESNERPDAAHDPDLLRNDPVNHVGRGTVWIRPKPGQLCVNDQAAGASQESKSSAEVALQGKFRWRDDSARSRVRPARPALLPRLAATSESLTAQNTTQTYHELQCQPKSALHIWHLPRKGYAVPGYARAFGNLPFSSSIATNGYSARVKSKQALNFRVQEHLVVPLIEDDDSPLGRAFTDFQQLGQRLIAQGVSSVQVADQGLFDVTLFFRERLPHDPVNASTWAAEMLRSFRGTFSDQLLLACAVCVGASMRWLLMQTPENYANMPSLVRPTRLQRLKPHPPWIDLMVFRSFRDALINNVRDWAEPCMKAGWEFLWPHAVEHALIHNADTGQIFLSAEFAAYVDDNDHWIMQKAILDAFPDIRDTEINISKE